MITAEVRKREEPRRYCPEICLLLRFPSARACCKNHCTNLYVPICGLLLCDLVNVAPLRLPNRSPSGHKFEHTSWYKYFFNPLPCVHTKLITNELFAKYSLQVDLRAHSEDRLFYSFDNNFSRKYSRLLMNISITW